MKKVKEVFLLVLLIIVSFGILTGGFYFLLGNSIETGNPIVEDTVLDKEYQNTNKKTEKNKSDVEKNEIVIKKDKKTTILAAGDMMYHMPQVRSAYDVNGYNFNGNLKFIKDYTSKNDINIVNFETVAAGNDKPFSGFPSFNSPGETIDSIKYAGFNIVNLANNHILDQGYNGLVNTIERIEKNDLEYIGASREFENKHIIKNVDDLKIGFLSYSYGFNGNEQRYTKDQLYSYVNKIDLEEIRKDIDFLNEEKVDFIVLYIHWGNEYINTPSSSQVSLKEELFNMGIDVILGSHPHVVQTSEYIEDEDNDKFVIYSMGNFISNQRKEIMKNPYTEDGLMVNLELVKTHDGKKKIRNINYIPTWVYKYKTDKYNYEIIPIKDALEGKIEVYNLENIRNNLNDSYKRTMDIINKKI